MCFHLLLSHNVYATSLPERIAVMELGQCTGLSLYYLHPLPPNICLFSQLIGQTVGTGIFYVVQNDCNFDWWKISTGWDSQQRQ